jgi:ABC-2 type transport system permease protein
LASTNLWIGVAVGLGLLAGAIWFRRWRDDS